MRGQTKALVAMSGGVDSSVAAYLLNEQGFEVIGVTMKMWEDNSRCCGLEDVEDARRVAQLLNIPHYVMSFQQVFKQAVIDYFIKEYLAGRTPNPCVVCNQLIKFGALLERAKLMGATHLATGHYARCEKRDGRYALLEPKDKEKSQTYFLALLSQDALSHALFPVGDYSKKEIREVAQRAGIKVAGKRESQDVCFIGESGYVDIIKRYAGVKEEEGRIVDERGNVLGKHKGIFHYTIGQRKRLGISTTRPLYVQKILPEQNLIIVASKEEVYKSETTVCDINWIAVERLEAPMQAWVKVRHKHPKARATLYPENNKIRVAFNKPQLAVTPGQLAVFYSQDAVVGAGWIDN